MSIDRKDVDKVLSLNDRDFRARVENAVRVSGLDPTVANYILKDSDKIKKALQGLSDKDLSKLSDTIKKNNLESIEKIFKESSKG